MAYKVFSNGNALNASELNTYLMNQSVMVFASTTARDAAITSPTEGMLVWLEDSNKYVYYTGSAWADLITPASSGNAIINGAFDIWQRGTSFSNPAFLAFNADRWQVATDAAPTTHTISRQTFTPGTAPVAGYEGQYHWRSLITTVGSNTVMQHLHTIEDVRTFAGQTASLSFWAKADSARTLGVLIEQNFGSGGSTAVQSATQNVSLTSSWTRFTVTFTVPSIAGKTVGTSSFLRLILIQPSASGSQLDLWGVQLEAGSVATPFKRNAPNIQAELAACQRYYYRATDNSTADSMGAIGQASSSTAALLSFQLPVSMRVQASSVDFANLRLFDSVNVASVTAVSLANPSPEVAQITASVASGLTQFRNYSLIGNTGGSFIGFNAEL